MFLIRRLWRLWMIRRLRLLHEKSNLPEKEEFKEALRASEEARSYARQSIAVARREMTWMENALTPDRQRRRLDCQE